MHAHAIEVAPARFWVRSESQLPGHWIHGIVRNFKVGRLPVCATPIYSSVAKDLARFKPVDISEVAQAAL
jgi:hypothetical protein